MHDGGSDDFYHSLNRKNRRLGERVGAGWFKPRDGTLALERPPRGRKANLAMARHLVQEWY